MPVDLQQAAWLKSESLDVLAAPAGGVAWTAAQSNDIEFTSPIDSRTDALTEAARTIAMVAGPNVKERIVVKGRRRDLLFKCVEVSFDRAGYIKDSGEGELVLNGTFGSTASWIGSGATLTAPSGQGVVSNTAAAQGYVYESLALVIGRSYRYRAELYAGSANPRFRIGTSQGGTQILNSTGVATVTGLFTPTVSPTFIAIGPSSNTAGATANFDNVSIKPELKRVFVIGVAENDNNTTTLTVIRSLV